MHALPAILGLVISIVLIFRKYNAAYSLMLGAFLAGILGGLPVTEVVFMPADSITVTATYRAKGTNVALKKPVTASGNHYENFPASYAVYDTIGTVWSTDHEGYPQWLEMDLGDVYNIEATELVWFNGRVYKYSIEVKSTESETYTQIVDRTDNTEGGSEDSPNRNEFETTARYVKLIVTGSEETTNYVNLSEFRVFGSIITSLNEKRKLAGITVYPNPAETWLTIDGQENHVNIGIYALHGDKIYETAHAVKLPYKVHISSFLSGTYVVKVSNNRGYFVEKVIKK